MNTPSVGPTAFRAAGAASERLVLFHPLIKRKLASTTFQLVLPTMGCWRQFLCRRQLSKGFELFRCN
jgi:hypothetical protein